MVLMLGVLAVLIVSVAGCTSSTNSNQAAGNTSQAVSTTASTSVSASASATPKAAPTAVPTAAPVVPTTPTTPTPTPTAIPTPTPTPTATVYILDMPSSVASGATMQIRIQVINSITGAGMPGVPVILYYGPPSTSITTGTNGEAIYSWTATPGGVGTTTQYVTLTVASTFGPNAYWGSEVSGAYQLVTPAVGNATA